tara:strand:- start:40 stop:207 length:168 start_codon:yes stop_codon:yes gene_type:complete
MSNAHESIDQSRFCEMLEEAIEVIDLSDGGQLLRLSNGQIAHFSVISGSGSVFNL